MLKHIYALGLPFAVLLPTSTMQLKKMGNLLQEHGTTVCILHPAPRFYKDGKKKVVCPSSWFFGNLSHHRQNLVETFWWPTRGPVSKAECGEEEEDDEKDDDDDEDYVNEEEEEED